MNATRPETFTFEEIPWLFAEAVGTRVWLVHTPPSLGLALSRLIAHLQRDVVLTRYEVDRLMAGLLTSDVEPSGSGWVEDWLEGNVGGLGGRVCF